MICRLLWCFVGFLWLTGCRTAGRLPSAAPTPPLEVLRGRDSGPVDLDARRWLEEDSVRAINEGAGPLVVLAGDVGSEGDRLGAFVHLPKQACVLVYARGSEGIDDLDLFAYGDDGSFLGADEAPDAHPTVLLCPPQPNRTYLAARVAAGRGMVAVGAHVVPNGALAKVARALGVRSRGEGAPPVESWPGLDAKVHGFRRELGGRWEELRRVAFSVDARAPAHVSVSLEAGRCLGVLLVPNDDVINVDAVLLDGDGRVVGRAAERLRDRFSVVCSSLSTMITLEARPHSGTGLAATVFLRSVEGSEPDIAVRADRIDAYPMTNLVAARTSLAKRLSPAGYSEPSFRVNGNADVGRRGSTVVTWPRGCARLDVIGGAPLAGVTADLWSDTGALLAHGEGGTGATLFVCGEAGRGRLDLEATARPGPYAIELRREGSSPSPLVSAGPLASRLLSRFNARGEVIPASAVTDAKTFPLDPAVRPTFETRLGERQCLEVGAAVGSGSSGIDLRLVDTTTHEEITSSRAAFATVARACATGASRPVTVELRLGSGKSDVLVGQRVMTGGR